MAVTLLEHAKIHATPLQMGVVETFARESIILARMPFMEVASDSYSFSREQTLGGAAFRALNSEYTEKTGTLDKVTESLAVLGGFSDTDRVLVKTSASGINDTRAVFDAMKAKAVALKFTRTVVKGNVATTPLEFDGWQERCIGNQLIAAGTSASGDALSLAVLDEAIDAVNGTPDLIVMNKVMARRMSVGARLVSVAGDLNYTIDEFGRRVTRYNGIEVGVIDRDEEDDLILDFDEECPGGGTDAGTSMYIVKFGERTHCCGLRCGDVAVEDLGIKNNVSYRTLIEFICGQAIFHPRSVARLFGISDASIVA